MSDAYLKNVLPTKKGPLRLQKGGLKVSTDLGQEVLIYWWQLQRLSL